MEFFNFNFLLLLSLLLIQYNSKIIFVLEHVRHGTRSPQFAENSNYIDEFGTKWPGDEDLTPTGERMHYFLGVHNRIKYSSLINFTRLNPKEILILTTDTMRTIKSAAAELHGMYLPGTGYNLTESELEHSYPPGKELLSEEANEEIQTLGNSTIINGISLFPIHFFENGKILLNEPENCPYMTSYRLESEKRIQKNITELLNDFDAKFGDKLKEYLNRPNKDFIHDFNNIRKITSNYICNYDDGKDLSDFLTKTGFDKNLFYEYATKIKFFNMFYTRTDQTAGIIGATSIMKDLINYMEKKIKNENNVTYSEPKMVIHSGHDKTISTILHFMDVAFEVPLENVKFGSHVYFELHKDDEDNTKYFVRYYFNGRLLLEKDFNTFKEKVLNTVWSDEKIHNFCYPKEENKEPNKEIKDDKNNNSAVITVLIITNIFTLIVTVIFIILFLNQRKKNNSINVDTVKNEKLLELN